MDSKDKRKFDDEGAQDPSSVPKQRKVIGPSLPPIAPTADATDSDAGSDSDDDFGPSLPPSDLLPGSIKPTPESSSVAEEPRAEPVEKENQRDQWMLQPPTQSDWASKIDPTQLRNRKFNTGKSATTTKTMDSAWVETPEERMRRLQDAVMGVGSSTNQARDQVASNTKSKEDQIKRYNVSFAPLVNLCPYVFHLTSSFYPRTRIEKTNWKVLSKLKRKMTTPVHVHLTGRRIWLLLGKYLVRSAGKWSRKLRIMIHDLQRATSYSNVSIGGD
jgi:hypothetical protein